MPKMPKISLTFLYKYLDVVYDIYFRYKKVLGTLGILGILGIDDMSMVVYYQRMAHAT